MWRLLIFIVSILHAYRSFENEHVYRIVEELPMKYLIGTFSSISSSSVQLQYHYNIVAKDTEVMNLFEISRTNGDLRTKIKIDRDTLCIDKKLCCSQKLSLDCEIKFKVIIRNDGSELSWKYFRVRVIIEDINDNIPKFLNSLQRLEISETTSIGSVINLPLAIDSDVGKNAVQVYTLNSDPLVFRLVMATISDVIYPRLELIDNIDRENIAQYSLELCAQDGGTPINRGCIKIDVIIIDANDNPPIIDHHSLVFKIPKNYIQSEKIGTIKATDRDEGSNALLQYYISDLAPLSIRSKISIDTTTGDIRLVRKFNNDPIRKPISQMIIPVLVVDQGSPRLSATATLTINLEDANDESPVISITDLKGKNPPRPHIFENKLPGQIAAFIHVVDSDQGVNGHVDCNLVDSPYFRIVVESGQRDAQEKEFKLESRQSLDREIQPTINLVLICKDKGTPSRTSSVAITVTVLDENDNYPVFHPNPVIVSLMENTPMNSLVVHLNITDADNVSSLKSAATCNMDSEENEYISIDQESCSLYTRKTIDREVIDKIINQVIATDKGSPPKQTTAQVIIKVVDENDNKPEFKQKVMEFRVRENQDPSIVVKLMAQDPDEGRNSEVTYQLSFHDNAAHMAFGVDLVSGNLYTKIRLDREKRSTYEFEVIAMDNGNVRLVSSATVKIIIEDTNDNNPKLIYPSRENRSHSFSLYNMKGTPLLKVVATDMDEGMNKDIIYEIVSGNHNGVFQLDPSSGQIYLAKDLQINDAGTYTIKIEARDNGDPSLKDTGVLRITFDSRLKVIPMFDRNGGILPKYQSDLDDTGSIIFGRNVILVICVVFVALLAVLVFLVMLYFMKKKQTYNTQMPAANVAEIESKHKPVMFALNQDQINITNNNLWNQGYNTLQLNSIGKPEDQYIPLSPTHSVKCYNDDSMNNYQKLIRRNEKVMAQISPISGHRFPSTVNDCSLLFANNANCPRESTRNVLFLNTPGSLSIKNRNTSSPNDNNHQVPLSNDTATNDCLVSSSFV